MTNLEKCLQAKEALLLTHSKFPTVKLFDLKPGTKFLLPGNKTVFTLVGFKPPSSFYPKVKGAEILTGLGTPAYWPEDREVIPYQKPQLSLF